jgi:hypothetical protein
MECAIPLVKFLPLNKGCDTLWPCHLHKKDLQAKEELWKVKYFTMQKYNPQKIL